MDSMTLPPAMAKDNIYLVARVFYLGLCGMALRLYLDPAKLRAEGKLQFNIDGSYSVIPGVAF